MKNKNNVKDARYSIRLTDNQALVLKELSEALDTSISMLVRMMVGEFITKNEDRLERIIVKHQKGDGAVEKDTDDEIFG